MPASPSPSSNPRRPTSLRVFREHPRRWQDFHYVYPVISRRSRGLSIGVNLNIDKACNFDCVYCCVDRSVAPIRRDIDLAQIRAELRRMIDLATAGQLWQEEPFTETPADYRVIRDIAFSGDGEPTTYKHFDQACQIAADLRREYRLDAAKIVVITNATGFSRPAVQRGLAILDANGGEIWAKLDAGTEAYYQQIDRTRVPLSKVLANILDCGRQRQIVIQSLFMQLRGQPISDAEFDAYLDRLEELLAGGCRIRLVQMYTVARQTAESFVSPLTPEQLDALARRFRQRLPQLPVETYQ